jgi:hypothetical protein
MSEKKYIPSNALAFLNFVQNLMLYAMANYPRWGLSQAVLNELQLLVDAYKAAVEVSENPDTRTSASITRRNERRADLEKKLRPFVQGQLEYNELVTDDDLTAMALPVHDHTPTKHPAPHNRPGLETTSTNNREHTVRAINQHTGKNTKPADAYGVRYVSDIRDTPPLNADDLRHSVFSRKTTRVYEYSEENRGKTVYYAACYENSKGEPGPWSDIVSAIIP